MRLEQLTFTRFLAAISIVIFHYGENIYPFNLEILSFVYKHAYVGVSYFFILSGFVMIIAYENKSRIDFKEYLKRRFARIYPVYFIAIIVLFSYYMITKQSISYKGMILSVFLLQSWIPNYALAFNYPGWSITVEFFFYIVFPLLFNKFYKRYPLKELIYPILFIFVGSQLIFHGFKYSPFYEEFPSKSHNLITCLPLMHLNEFLIGNVAALYFLKGGIRKGNYDLVIVGLVILVALILEYSFGIYYNNGMLAFIFVPLIVLISSNNGTLTTIFNRKIFIFLGEISYGIYILQVPVFQWIDFLAKKTILMNTTLIFYISLLALIVLSAISYKFIETPLRRKISNLRTTW